MLLAPGNSQTPKHPIVHCFHIHLSPKIISIHLSPKIISSYTHYISKTICFHLPWHNHSSNSHIMINNPTRAQNLHKSFDLTTFSQQTNNHSYFHIHNQDGILLNPKFKFSSSNQSVIVHSLSIQNRQHSYSQQMAYGKEFTLSHYSWSHWNIKKIDIQP